MNKKNDNRDEKKINVETHENIVTKKILWSPMLIIQGYLSIVLFLFLFGPWPWPTNNKLLVSIYLITAQLLVVVGFYFSLKKKYIPSMKNKLRFKKKLNINKIIKILLFISIILFIPTYLSRVGINSFNIGMFFDSFINGLMDPGEQYHNKLGIQDQVSTNLFLLILTLIISPFSWLLFPLTIVYWKQINYKYKFGVIVLLLLDTISWISIGTNKGIFDNVFIVAFSLLIKMSLENKSTKKIMTISKSKSKMLIFSLLGLLGAITYFINAIISRLGRVNYYYRAADIYVNENSLVMQIIPDFFKDIIIVISSYTTQGYYALSLAMNETFTSTYGFGNSWFLLSIYEMLTGNSELELKTYPFKLMKYGWDPYINWHSIYTWLASDFSFIGTLFIMLIIGYFFGEVWKSVLFKHNIFAIGLFVLLMIMFMYFPANNQIFAFTQTFFSFWGLFFLWILTSKVKIVKEKKIWK